MYRHVTKSRTNVRSCSVKQCKHINLHYPLYLCYTPVYITEYVDVFVKIAMPCMRSHCGYWTRDNGEMSLRVFWNNA